MSAIIYQTDKRIGVTYAYESTAEEDSRHQFFRRQGRRRTESEFWVYDSTSISSYSQALRQVKRGFNKEHDPLEQINLALLFGEQSSLPFYYRKLPGNIRSHR
jgi:transposase